MIEKIDILLIISSLALILSIISTIIGLIAVIKVFAMEKSTHTITYQPVDEAIDKHNEEYLKNWATKESKIAEDQELFKEDLEEQMPDFYETEEDKKVYTW